MINVYGIRMNRAWMVRLRAHRWAEKQINGSFVVGFPLLELKILTEMELMWQFFFLSPHPFFVKVSVNMDTTVISKSEKRWWKPCRMFLRGFKAEFIGTFLLHLIVGVFSILLCLYLTIKSTLKWVFMWFGVKLNRTWRAYVLFCSFLVISQQLR